MGKWQFVYPEKLAQLYIFYPVHHSLVVHELQRTFAKN